MDEPVWSRATENWNRARERLGVGFAPLPSSRTDFIEQARAELAAEAQAWLDARDAEFDDRWNARMNP